MNIKRERGDNMSESNLIDPRSLFHGGKFKKQVRETPALQDEMGPKPDCGEDSYVGSEKLENRRY